MESQPYTKISLNEPEIDKIEFLLLEGKYFQKNKKIAQYWVKTEEKGMDPQLKSYYVYAPFYGKFTKYEKDTKTIILEKCPHDSFYLDLCTKCNYNKSNGDDSDYEKANKNFAKKTHNYSSLDSCLTFTEEMAKKEEISKVNKYLSSKKLILLLDLDNTIIHTCGLENINQEEYKNLKEQYKEYISYISIRSNITFTYKKILVKFRPYLKELLNFIQDKYEIFTYTHGTKDYATGIIEYINRFFFN